MVLQRMRVRVRWLLALGALGLTGCYAYIPTQVGGPTRGTAVRATLKHDPVYEVGDRRIRDVVSVEGQVIAWERDTLSLSATELRTEADQGFDGGGYTVKLALSDVSDVSIKRLSKTRTALVVVGAAVAALLGQKALTGAFDANGSGTTGNSKQ